MAYNVYVDVVNELYSRINSAMQLGTFPILFSLRFSSDQLKATFLRVGATQSVEGNDYLPSIQILWGGSSEDYAVIASGQMSAKMTLIVRLHYPLDDPDNANVLFDISTKTGILYFIEEILDVINTKTEDGSADPRMLANSKDSLKVTVGDINKMKDKLTCDITLTLGTKQFPINRRQQGD